MRRSMELAERRAREEASRRDEYAKSLEAKFDKERQEYRRQVSLLHIQLTSRNRHSEERHYQCFVLRDLDL